jgi:hypothetical protein
VVAVMKVKNEEATTTPSVVVLMGVYPTQTGKTDVWKPFEIVPLCVLGRPFAALLRLQK